MSKSILLIVFLAVFAIICHGQDYQPAIFDPLLQAGAHIFVIFKPSVTKDQAQKTIAAAVQLINTYSSLNGTKFSATIGIGIELAQQWFPRYSSYNTFAKENGPISSYASTAGDVLVHVKTQGRDIAFEFSKELKTVFASTMSKFTDEYAFSYLMDPNTGMARDVSGFIDGTANPQTRKEQEKWAIIPSGYTADEPGGGSWVLTQKWVHFALDQFTSSPLRYQEETIGRRKSDSAKLDNIDPRAHIVRSKAIDGKGFELKIFRQSQSFGDTYSAGLHFIAYAKNVTFYEIQLNQMRNPQLADYIFRFSSPVTGQFWYIPSLQELKSFGATMNKRK